jgi:hypothetical protein
MNCITPLGLVPSNETAAKRLTGNRLLTFETIAMSVKGTDRFRALKVLPSGAAYFIFILLLGNVTGQYNFQYNTGQYLTWTSSYPDGTPTGRSGKVDFELAWAGQNAPDENGSGGMTRRIVLAFEKESCMELCQEPALSNQACVTSTEGGQLAGVPIKNSILLYIVGDVTHSGHGCQSWQRPWINDFIERSGAAAALMMNELGVFEESGRPWVPGSDLNHSLARDALAPEKTLAYHKLTNPNGPEPRLISKLTKPYGVIFSHAKAPHGVANVGGLTMRQELEAGMAVDVFWPGTGAMVPEERAVLKEFLSGVRNAFHFTWGGGSGGGLSISDFLADDTIDPCLNRLEDSTCIGGRIVAFSHDYWWLDRLPCNAFEILAKFPKGFRNSCTYHLKRNRLP